MNDLDPRIEALILLAKRANPDSRWWYNVRLKHTKQGETFDGVECHICGTILELSDDIGKHGMKHLEESGLLAFL